MSNSVSDVMTIEPTSRVRGQIRVPGDKSMSHRYAILAALADGTSTFGVPIQIDRSTDNQLEITITVDGLGLGGLHQASEKLNARNSGTTIRLLAGVLASHPFDTTIIGDDSLCNRPMQRVVDPLEAMGARIDTHNGCPPITVHGGELCGIKYAPVIPSAQVKSAILLAGLQAKEHTLVQESLATRDHTELALQAFGVEISLNSLGIEIKGGQRLISKALQIPGDLSSAAFWAAAAAALPNSDIEIIGVGLNPTRMFFLELLRKFGANVLVETTGIQAGEPFGIVRVRHKKIKPLVIEPNEVPSVIDELPALAALASHGGDLKVRGARELRQKESDRIAVLAVGLRQFGVLVDECPDGFHINGESPRTGGTVDAKGDHRMAMAFAIAALGATSPSVIKGHNAVEVSYPSFFKTLTSICE
jgi:3-phosphoshikimate 1-carboxyvinyltransferase